MDLGARQEKITTTSILNYVRPTCSIYDQDQKVSPENKALLNLEQNALRHHFEPRMDR